MKRATIVCDAVNAPGKPEEERAATFRAMLEATNGAYEDEHAAPAPYGISVSVSMAYLRLLDERDPKHERSFCPLKPLACAACNPREIPRDFNGTIFLGTL